MNYTLEMIKELEACYCDPEYFISMYLELDKEEDIAKIKHIHENKYPQNERFYSDILCAYTLWHACYNSNSNVAYIAPKHSWAMDANRQFRRMYDYLPTFLKPTITECNRYCTRLDNGSSIFWTSARPGALRGLTLNLILFERYDVLTPQMREETLLYALPCLMSTPQNAKIIVEGYEPILQQ